MSKTAGDAHHLATITELLGLLCWGRILDIRW